MPSMIVGSVLTVRGGQSRQRAIQSVSEFRDVVGVTGHVGHAFWFGTVHLPSRNAAAGKLGCNVLPGGWHVLCVVQFAAERAVQRFVW